MKIKSNGIIILVSKNNGTSYCIFNYQYNFKMLN